MNDPSAYDTFSKFQNDHAREFVPYFVSMMSWTDAPVQRPCTPAPHPGVGTETVVQVPKVNPVDSEHQKMNILDFGCGSGFVTKNILLSAIPSQSHPHIYGLDVSKAMIDFAQANYADPAITYVHGDLMQEKTWEQLPEKFDKIFSMFVIHWIKDQRELFSKFFKILNPKGEIGFYCIASSIQYSVFASLSKDPTWASHLTDVEKFIPKSHFSADFGKEMKELLESVGFEVQESRIIKKEYVFDTEQIMLNMGMAVDPFFSEIPIELQNNYKKDYWASFKHHNLVSNNRTDVRQIPYNVILVRATVKKN